MIAKSWVAWLTALWIGLAVHLDWHLGRPGLHEDRSYHLAYHGFVELSSRPYVDDCVTDRVAYLDGWYVAPGEETAQLRLFRKQLL